ncbi:MAG: TolC family protein [Syntrophobacteraceae bacterium]
MRGICTCLILIVLLGGCASNPPEETALINNPSMWEKEVPPSKVRPEELPGLTAQSTLNDYLVYAALNNPGLKASYLQWMAALEKIPQVTTLPDPQLGYMYYIQQGVMAPQRQGLAVTETFPWFGKLKLKGNAAADAARAQKARYDAAQLKLFFEVKDAYYEYYYLAQAISVTKENLGYVKYLESVARAGYASGTISYADVVQAQVELGKLEDRLKTLSEEADPVAAKLNAALNRPADAPLFRPRKIKEEKVSFTTDQLLKWLKQSNPDLRAIDFQASGAKWNINLAKKDYYPDVTLGIQGFDTGRRFVPNDPVMATASINVPIWWGKYRAEVREARANYESFLRQRSDRANTLMADVKFAVYKFKDADRKIALYRDSLVPEAKQALEVSLEAYQAGKASYANVVDAIRNLLEFELSYERALTDREQSLAKLEMLVGRAIPGS